MTTQNRTDVTVQTGWDVLGSDGESIGNVAEVGANYVRVEKGLIFVKDIYIPVSAISQIDPADEALWLNIPKDDIESMGWDNLPSEGSWDDLSGRSNENEWSMRDTTSGSAGLGSAGHGDTDTSTSDRQRLSVHEEQLEARKTARQAGEVEVRKEVIEEQQTIHVPVTREEVHVRRVGTDRDATASDTAFTDGDTIRVPVMEEEVQVTKRPRVVEEVEVEKVARQDTEQATGTVRKERVDVSGEGAVHRR